MSEKEPKSVLVVEDEVDGMWFEIYEEIFEEMGASVVGVASLAEALELLYEREFTHVVSDGLKGDYVGVVQASQEVGVKNIVIVSRDDIEERVTEMGVRFISKGKFDERELID